ncbi:MAG: DUF4401 domain-containing protein [Bryobacterales bacterium]|nr:DUF4401 domain-containing protein [Bryobacterales bacterium]
MTRAELWARLLEAGLVHGEMPPAREAPTPWPVRVMMGVAGWFGGLLLLGFAGMTFAMLFRSEAVALPVGVACCMAALAAFHLAAGSALLSQFGFAVSVAGQVLIFFGLGEMLGSHSSVEVLLLMAVLEALLAAGLPNAMHRVFTAAAANVFLLMAAHVGGFAGAAIAVTATGAAAIWLAPEWMATAPDVWRPLGYGLALALAPMDGSLLAGPQIWSMILREGPAVLWWGQAATGLVLCWTAWRIGGGWTGVGLAAPLAVLGIWAPGISAAVLVVTLGFANRNRILMGLGMVAFAGYLSHFYYQLDLTLLAKAGALTGTGLALLAMRWAVRRA